MAKLFIEDIDLSGKKVIVRVDFNVPLKNGVVENDKRLRASLPTINYLVSKGTRLILMSHLGRPKGKIVEEMRMAPVAKALGELLGQEVKSVDDCLGEKVWDAIDDLNGGDILLLENLRFHKGETENDKEMAKELSSFADVYVNDAFGSAHRAHASTEGITQFMETCACGYLMKKELDFLGEALSSPKAPFVAVIGGAKISGKIDVIEALIPKVDALLIGGGMTYTFLKAQGIEIGKSLCEEDKIDLAKSLLEKGGDKIILPTDYLITDYLDFNNRKLGSSSYVKDIPADQESVDIGPESMQHFSEIITNAKTVIWNGPMGVFEIEESAKGTIKVAEALVRSTEQGGITIIGGGDSAAAIEKANLADKVSHVSTGGGASLEFLEGKKLPGVEALSDKTENKKVGV